MFKFTQSSTERVEKQKVWQLYADTNSWSQWDKGVKGVRLAGPFAAGTQGVMEMLCLFALMNWLRAKASALRRSWVP